MSRPTVTEAQPREKGPPACQGARTRWWAAMLMAWVSIQILAAGPVMAEVARAGPTTKVRQELVGPAPVAASPAPARPMLDDLFPYRHERTGWPRYIPNGWVVFGFGGQFLFFMRFVVQWYVSEKRKRVTVPLSFWYLSIAGSLTIFIYAAHRRDIVFVTAQLLACVIYVRNLMLIYRRRRALGEKTSPGAPPAKLDDGTTQDGTGMP